MVVGEIGVSRIVTGPESDHWQCLSVTDSLTPVLVNLMPANDDAVQAVYNWQRLSNSSAGFTTYLLSW